MDFINSLLVHVTPFVATIGYLMYPQKLRINSALLYGLSIIHNGVLIVFSAWTFYSLSQILYTYGIVYQQNYYFQNPHFENVIYLFYMSKYYEFFDTFILYLNNKKPIFLQKYHHIGAVVCWHLSYTYRVDAIWIPSLVNSFIHTIMYTYYLGSLLKINQLKFIKKYITSLQLTQFILTPPFTSIIYLPIENQVGRMMIYIFNAYTAGLIILFSQFYYNTYIKVKSS